MAAGPATTIVNPSGATALLAPQVTVLRPFMATSVTPSHTVVTRSASGPVQPSPIAIAPTIIQCLQPLQPAGYVLQATSAQTSAPQLIPCNPSAAHGTAPPVTPTNPAEGPTMSSSTSGLQLSGSFKVYNSNGSCLLTNYSNKGNVHKPKVYCSGRSCTSRPSTTLDLYRLRILTLRQTVRGYPKIRVSLRELILGA